MNGSGPLEKTHEADQTVGSSGRGRQLRKTETGSGYPGVP